MCLWALTSVSKMNQRSEGFRIDPLHLDLLLLRLSHIAGKHRSKVVRHGAQDKSAIRKMKCINAAAVKGFCFRATHWWFWLLNQWRVFGVFLPAYAVKERPGIHRCCTDFHLSCATVSNDDLCCLRAFTLLRHCDKLCTPLFPSCSVSFLPVR